MERYKLVRIDPHEVAEAEAVINTHAEDGFLIQGMSKFPGTHSVLVILVKDVPLDPPEPIDADWLEVDHPETRNRPPFMDTIETHGKT
jgi:hypothetical protein